jgi:hypothetical protein
MLLRTIDGSPAPIYIRSQVRHLIRWAMAGNFPAGYLAYFFQTSESSAIDG